jgi:hypothetical protein
LNINKQLIQFFANKDQSNIRSHYAQSIEKIFEKKVHNASDKKKKQYEVYDPKPIKEPDVPAEFK